MQLQFSIIHLPVNELQQKQFTRILATQLYNNSTKVEASFTLPPPQSQQYQPFYGHYTCHCVPPVKN